MGTLFNVAQRSAAATSSVLCAYSTATGWGVNSRLTTLCRWCAGGGVTVANSDAQACFLVLSVLWPHDVLGEIAQALRQAQSKAGDRVKLQPRQRIWAQSVLDETRFERFDEYCLRVVGVGADLSQQGRGGVDGCRRELCCSRSGDTHAKGRQH